MSDLELKIINLGAEKFYNEVANSIKDYLPEEYENAVISLEEAIKNNDTTLKAMTVRKPGDTVGPRLYLNDLYVKYIEGTEMEDILEGIADTIRSARTPEFDADMIRDYNIAKNNIKIQLCDPELNHNILKNRPHTIVGDFACLYKVRVSADDDGIMNAPIDNNLMKTWGIDVEQLHQDAINSPLEQDYTLTSMEDILAEMMGFKDVTENLLDTGNVNLSGNHDMFVLTNTKKIDGAAGIINSDVMEEVGKLIGNCYVIPSSIHEVILVPDNGEIEAEVLEGMIGEVNTAEVAADEILSYKAQYYDTDLKVLVNAREHENPINGAMKKQNKDNFFGK